MQPKCPEHIPQEDLFRSQLDQIINMKHELVKLAHAVDWGYLEAENAKFYSEEGRPGVRARLIIGIQLLKQMYNLSDEVVCEQWVVNPYFQYFCGEMYFQHELIMDRSSMSNWRKRAGEEFCEKLLQESLSTAYRLEALKINDVKKVVVDTTVQPKAITFPTDAKLYYRALIALGKQAKELGLELRQSYPRVAKHQLIAVGRYSHAKQMKRANKARRKLHTYLGRVLRDIERQIEGNPEMTQSFAKSLIKGWRIHTQKRKDSNKLYSWHAPEVECIGKGKVDKPYEFGCKVSITTNMKSAPAGHFVLHAKALHGNPYDGHTLKEVISGVTKLTGIEPYRTFVDKGYRGHNYQNKHRVFRSGQKRGVTASIKKELKRRSVVEPLIGHMKNEGRLGRNFLLGELGDKLNTLLVAAGYNFKLILKWLKKLLAFILFACLFQNHFIFAN